VLVQIQLLRGYAVALALTFAVTGVIALIRTELDVANISMLYLLPVLAAAVLYGTGPAVFASVAAFLSFDFFFVEPQHTFTVSDSEEWVGLVLLLGTGIVTGQLAGALQNRARDAQRREREAVVLYDVVRMMAEPDLQRALTTVAERVRTELGLASVTITFGAEQTLRAQADTGEPEALALARDALALSGKVLARGAGPSAGKRGETGRWIKVVSPVRGVRQSDRVRRVPIDLHGTEVGTLILVSEAGAQPFAREEDRLLLVVANQLGLTLERLQLQREANEAEVLRRTDELRTALMNAVSHDLRTPLASIIASAGSLRQEDVRWSEAERQEFLGAIEQEAERLNRLVGNLLDLSRIEAGTLKPEMGWYDLASLLEEVTGRLRFLTASHKVTLDVPQDLPPIEFDYVEIDQVITNLIENAIKYTPQGSEIAVRASRKDGRVQIEVADNGPGIPDGALPRLFDAFYRGVSDHRPQGSGLGLAVAKGLVEAHGGRIWAENRPEGGARFAFTLPVTSATAEEVPA
jgi:two-component system sensor histidine kinase KdpD